MTVATSHVAHPHLRRPRVNPWLIGVVALAAALVALGGWVIFDDEAPPEGLASAEATSMLSDRIAAFNTAGVEDMSRFYAPNAILEEHDVSPVAVTRGSKAIGDRLEYFSDMWDMAGLRIASESAPIQLGPYVAEAASIGQDWDGILVYKLDQNGKIEHQWVIGP